MSDKYTMRRLFARRLRVNKETYECDKCKLRMYIDFSNGSKGCRNINKDFLICPVCSSMDKEPTLKISDDELNRRKLKIKERLGIK